LMCLLLAAIGLYSVMSYAVSQRTQELGVRMALGAQPSDVLRMIAKEALRLTALGIVTGIVASLAASRFVEGMLVGVKPSDPITFLAAALFLTLVVLLASYFPGRRATRIDPVNVLRHE
jgi:putative ABC transport system permease protein